MTRIEDALAEAFRVLRPGGRLMVLEFSQVPEPTLQMALRPLLVQRHPADGAGAGRGPGDATSTSSSRSGASRTRRRFAGDDPRGGVRPGAVSQPVDGDRRAAFGLEALRDARAAQYLAAGPHRRDLRADGRDGRGARRRSTRRRSLRVAARVLGWPFQWLGLKGDPTQPPVLAGDHRARAGLHQVRPADVDAAGRGRAGAGGGAHACCRTSSTPSRRRRRARRWSASSAAGGRGLLDVRAAGGGGVDGAGASRDAARDGQVVAVKVLRPGIERAFLRDVDAFYFAATMIEMLAPFARRLRPRAVITALRGRGAGRARPAAWRRRRRRSSRRTRERDLGLPGAAGGAGARRRGG